MIGPPPVMVGVGVAVGGELGVDVWLQAIIKTTKLSKQNTTHPLLCLPIITDLLRNNLDFCCYTIVLLLHGTVFLAKNVHLQELHQLATTLIGNY